MPVSSQHQERGASDCNELVFHNKRNCSSQLLTLVRWNAALRKESSIYLPTVTRYRQSVQHRPNSNMTETQIPNKFNSVLLKNHEKASGCVARNCYQYFGHNFHDKFHRDRRLYDSGIYSCGSDKHKHCNNTVSRYVPPNVPLVFMSTFSRGAHACLTLTLLTWRIW